MLQLRVGKGGEKEGKGKKSVRREGGGGRQVKRRQVKRKGERGRE